MFDSFKHPTEEAFINFIEPFGVPDFILFLNCEERTVKDRWMKKNDAEDVPEDQVEAFKEENEA